MRWPKYDNGMPVGLTGAVIGIALGLGIPAFRGCENRSYIPRTEQVQQGYIAPSRLEIECKDLDGNGEPETIMKIGDQSYLLREVDGKPVLSAYEVKPAEVVPKK